VRGERLRRSEQIVCRRERGNAAGRLLRDEQPDRLDDEREACRRNLPGHGRNGHPLEHNLRSCERHGHIQVAHRSARRTLIEHVRSVGSRTAVRDASPAQRTALVDGPALRPYRLQHLVHGNVRSDTGRSRRVLVRERDQRRVREFQGAHRLLARLAGFRRHQRHHTAADPAVGLLEPCAESTEDRHERW